MLRYSYYDLLADWGGGGGGGATSCSRLSRVALPKKGIFFTLAVCKRLMPFQILVINFTSFTEIDWEPLTSNKFKKGTI